MYIRVYRIAYVPIHYIYIVYIRVSLSSCCCSCVCVVRTYVISGESVRSRKSGLCVLTCCLWKGEKTRNSVESEKRKHQ